MKDKPLILSLLVGLIMVLVVASVSFLVQINSLSGHRDDLAKKNMALEKKVEELKAENVVLSEKNKGVTDELGSTKVKMDELKIEIARLEKLKEKLEDNLKDELMKTKEEVKEKK